MKANYHNNVRAVTSDIKNASNYNLVASSWRFLADIRSLNNYHPYGSLIDAGSWSGSSYNFGYNGMLKENIGKNIYHTQFRTLSDDRWMSPDPLEYMFPDVSPYLSMGGNPINFVDLLGLKPENPPENADKGGMVVSDDDGTWNWNAKSQEWKEEKAVSDDVYVYAEREPTTATNPSTEAPNNNSPPPSTSIPKKNYFGETPVDGPNTADMFYIPMYVGYNALLNYTVGVEVDPGPGFAYRDQLKQINTPVNTGIGYVEAVELAMGVGAFHNVGKVTIKKVVKEVVKKKTISQLRMMAKRGQVPKGIIRFDAGKGTKNLPMDEVHFDKNGASLYRDGTWRHPQKTYPLNNKQKKFLKEQGWKLPNE